MPATSIPQGKLIFQLESSDVCCKQLPSVLPEVICSPLSISLCRAQPLSWAMCTKTHLVPEESLCLQLHLLKSRSFITAQKIVLHRNANIYETHMLFLFCFIFFINTKSLQNFVESSLPYGFFFFRNFLALPPHHLGNLITPTVFSAVPRCSRGICSKNLPVIC